MNTETLIYIAEILILWGIIVYYFKKESKKKKKAKRKIKYREKKYNGK